MRQIRAMLDSTEGFILGALLDQACEAREKAEQTSAEKTAQTKKVRI